MRWWGTQIRSPGLSLLHLTHSVSYKAPDIEFDPPRMIHSEHEVKSGKKKKAPYLGGIPQSIL